MTDRIERLLKDYENILNQLKNGINIATDDLDIDGVLKRFEIVYEIAWKLIKLYLSDKGIICVNPRDCFREAFRNSLIDNEKNWSDMIKDRNELVHIYAYEKSREIFKRVKGKYLNSFTFLLKKIREGMDEQ